MAIENSETTVFESKTFAALRADDRNADKAAVPNSFADGRFLYVVIEMKRSICAIQNSPH